MHCVDDKTWFVFRKVKHFFLRLLNLVSFGEIYKKQAVSDFFFFYLEKHENFSCTFTSH